MAIKIMYLMDYYIHPRGGTEGQVLQLIKYLDKSRYVPSMTLLRRSKYIEQGSFPCPVEVLDIAKIVSAQTILKLLRFGLALRRQGFRIVHCFFNDVSLVAPPLLKILGIRVLVSRRDLGLWYTPRLLVVLRLVSLFVDRYVANSQAVKRIVQEQECVAGKKISVIYNGYLPVARKTYTTDAVHKTSGLPADGRIIGIVANLRRIKRVDSLVKAFGAIYTDFPDVWLLIVGDCESQQAKSVFEELVALAYDLGVGDRVIFTGSVDEPAQYIDRFTVAVLCSESEGFSNALIEYMQAGRPVICTDTGGNPELVVDGINGFIVPVGDTDALADRLLKLLSDSALAWRLGKAARETIRLNYSYTRMITEHMTCYDELLSACQFDPQSKRASNSGR
jgi:glycosyltransferase involved in cell wall biosynthesis